MAPCTYGMLTQDQCMPRYGQSTHDKMYAHMETHKQVVTSYTSCIKTKKCAVC